MTRSRRRGSLMVVGIGLNGAPQTTLEALACMRQADRLFYLATNPLTEVWLRTVNPRATSLHDLYRAGKLRSDTYEQMTDRLVDAVRCGDAVCAAFYGHPGVLAQATHAAIRRLTRLGHCARMLPGVSADGCLYADLGLNPGDRGTQSFEATDFLLARRRFDPTSELLLWQVGVIGELFTRDVSLPGSAVWLASLVRRLRRAYPGSHRVVLYEAATFPGAPARIVRVRLDQLARTTVRPTTTLYVPALPQRPQDMALVRRIMRS